MRVLLSTYGSHGNVKPMRRLAVQLGAPNTKGRVHAPPHSAELLAGVAGPLVELAQLVRLPVAKAPPADLPLHMAEEGDAPCATGVMPTGGWQ